MTYQLFVGANNATGEVDRDIVENVLNRHFDGYTIVDSVGYWLGVREKSLVVTLTASKQTLNKVLAELKTELEQDAIAWQQAPALHFF